MSSERERHMLRHERKIWRTGVTRVAGIDEAGRGPLAGPVVAAAVLIEPGFFIEDVRDSKRLSPRARLMLFDRILLGACAVGVGVVDHKVIDEINILNATFRAMHEAVEGLGKPPEYLLVDGNRFQSYRGEGGEVIPHATIVQGDNHSFSIAAASIVAKVSRDRMMEQYDGLFPGYGFARNKGYPTLQHREALKRLGPCPIHRRTFAWYGQYVLPLEPEAG